MSREPYRGRIARPSLRSLAFKEEGRAGLGLDPLRFRASHAARNAAFASSRTVGHPTVRAVADF
jgi:hypothetical protein